MKKEITELVFILDRSGSMSGLERETINGFNSMINKLKSPTEETLVTTVLFDNEYEILHDGVDIEKLKPLTDKEYYVRGMTALLDAVGTTISKIVDVKKRVNREKEKEKVIFVITTDGYENASREFTLKKVKKMIEHQQEKYGWDFIFMGANMDAVGEAEKMGIPMDRAATYSYDTEGVDSTYEAVSDFVMESRISMLRASGDWKKKVK